MEPLYLVAGDRVVAEPVAVRLGSAIAQQGSHEVEVVRRPAGLGNLLASLRTLSLFSTRRTVVAVETAVLADRAAAADLLDEAASVEPPEAATEWTSDERWAAARLLQALRLFGVEPQAGPAERAVAGLPAWALQGGRAWRAGHGNRPRGPRQIEEMSRRLASLLAAARAAELRGWAEGDLEELGELARGGFPPGHTLILAEGSVAGEHPLARWLDERGALVRVGRVEARKGAWEGLATVVATLADETGVAIEHEAVTELARRTLLREGRDGPARPDSTERFAAEYRKLAALVPEGRIGVDLIEATVTDRGDEDLFKLLDAVGTGATGEALARADRYLSAAEDPMAARLVLFGLLASFARQLVALAGLARAAGVPGGESSFARFRELAPRLQNERPGGAENPFKGWHPYRLHRTYLAATRRSDAQLARLPRRVLEAELLLKGGSRRPDAVMSELVADLAR